MTNWHYLVDICKSEVRLDQSFICYKLVQHSIKALHNLMYDCLENRQSFLELNGLDNLMEVQFTIPSIAVKKCVWSAIRILIGRFMSEYKSLEFLGNDCNNLALKINENINNEKKDQEVLAKGILHKGAVYKVYTEEETDDSSDDDKATDSCNESSTSVLDSSLSKAVHDAYTIFNDEKCYIDAYNLVICNNEFCEMSTVTSASEISATSVGITVCGMLNSGKGGIIYFGISSEGVVKGITLNRDERDGFRLGIDQLMTRHLSPILGALKIIAKFVPVVRITDTKTIKLEDLYVIELVIEKNLGTIFTFQENYCYVRKGAETILKTMEEIRQHNIEEEENYYIGIMTTMQKAVDKIKLKLRQK